MSVGLGCLRLDRQSNAPWTFWSFGVTARQTWTTNPFILCLVRVWRHVGEEFSLKKTGRKGNVLCYRNTTSNQVAVYPGKSWKCNSEYIRLFCSASFVFSLSVVYCAQAVVPLCLFFSKLSVSR